MRIREYLSSLKTPLKPRTLCFLVNDNQVLLGRKKEDSEKETG